MKSIDKIKKIFAGILVLFTTSLVAQNDLTIHFFNQVPQSNAANPSNMPDFNWYIGVPALSSVFVDVKNSGFTYNQAIEFKTDTTFTIKIDDILDRLKPKNFIGLKYQQEILGFGFRAKEQFFTFSYSERMQMRFTYPKDFIGWIWKGNAHDSYLGKEARFEYLGLDAMQFSEFAIGYAKKIDDNLTIGIRPKLWFGRACISFDKSNEFYIKTYENDYAIESKAKMMIHTSVPDAFYNAGTPIDTIVLDSNFEFNNEIKSSQISKMAINPQNMGFAIDLGATYQLDEKLSIAFAAVDLGYINWKHNVKNVYTTETAKFKFSGFDVYQFLNDSARGDTLEKLMDSLVDIFDVKDDDKAFKTWVGPKFYLSASYMLTDKDRFAGLFRAEFYKGDFYPSLTVGYERKLGRYASIMANYSAYLNNYANLGYGITFNTGPVQWYFMQDNFLAYFLPNDTKYFNLHFGLNLIFGRGKDSKPRMGYGPDYLFQ